MRRVKRETERKGRMGDLRKNFKTISDFIIFKRTKAQTGVIRVRI